jgi:MFS family permease
MADLAGLTPAFALEVLLLIAAALVFSTIATDRPVPSGASVFSDLKAGMQYVWGKPAIFALLCLGTVPGVFFIAPFMVTIPLVVPDLLERSDKWVGILSGCFGSGVVFGSILLAARPIPRRGLAIIVATISGGVVLGIYGLSDHVALSAVALFVWGLGASVFINYASGLVQEHTEAHVMGRVMSMYFLSFQLAQPVGFVLTGTIVSVFGLREALVANAIAALVIGVLCLLFLKPVRELR